MGANAIVNNDIERWSLEKFRSGVEIDAMVKFGGEVGGHGDLNFEAFRAKFLESGRHDWK